MIDVNGRDYEVGGSIIHPRNKYMVDFLKLFGELQLSDSDGFLNCPMINVFLFLIYVIFTCIFQ